MPGRAVVADRQHRGAPHGEGHHIVETDVGPDATGPLRGVEQRLQEVVQPRHRGRQDRARPARVGRDHVADGRAAARGADDVQDESEEGLGGRGPGHPPLAGGDQLAQLLGEHRLDEGVLGREVPVHRACADARPAGDVPERDIEPPLRERLARRRQHPGPVAAGVAPVARAGHRRHVTKPLAPRESNGLEYPRSPG